MIQTTGEFPRAIPRPVWLTARARNAAKRPLFIGAVAIGAFVATLLALILAPQQVRQTPPPPLSVEAVPDTAPLVAALEHTRARLALAESSLAVARTRGPLPQPAPLVDTLSPQFRARRDSLSTAIADLDALLTRVETAPVSAAYRALGESPRLAQVPAAQALLDSLDQIDSTRAALGTADSTDPVLMAVNARSDAIGRSLQELARARRDSLRQAFATLGAPAMKETVAPTATLDTAEWIAERDSARSLVRQARQALVEARGAVREHDRAMQRERENARFEAPPVALLAAALIFGVAIGFGSALVSELRHPRVSDEHELERVTGARVLATIRPRPRNPERYRRASDRAAPPYFDPAADGYQLTYLHMARAGASRLTLALTGEELGIAAVVAMNVGAIAADEARSTIVIDTDAQGSSVAAALRIHAEPGVADILERRLEWAEVTSSAVVGRDRTIDVVPSGLSSTERPAAEVAELFRRDAARLARHYEAIVVVAPLDQIRAGLAAALPIPDTILCARIGHTRLSSVQAALEGIRAAGGSAAGVVLWDAAPPGLPSPARIARAPRPLNTPTMQALTPTTK